MSDKPVRFPAANRLPLYATAVHPCNYLPGREARSQAVVPAAIVSDANYGRLMEQGFRRSGIHTYRPWCDGCSACESLRIAVDQFTLNRTQRRVMRQHSDLRVQISPLVFSEQHYALYQQYQHARHAGGGMDSDNADEYREFILESLIPAGLVEFYQGNTLKMVSLVDVVPEALSAVYTFYADDPGASYGTYSILWQIEHARRMRRPHLYLGYWIADSVKMQYKSGFRPHQVLRNGAWVNVV